MAIYNAVFRIDQDRPTPPSPSVGSPGVSRKDLWLDRMIHLVPTSPPTAGGTTYLWKFLDKPTGSTSEFLDDTTGLPSDSSQLVKFDPDVWGTYRVLLTINNGQYSCTMLCAVILSSAGLVLKRAWRIPAFKEIDTEANFPGQSRGYAYDWDFIFNDIINNGFGPGGDFTAGGDLEGTATEQTVIGIRARSVANTTPTDGQILTWLSGTAEWSPEDAPVGFTAGGDLSGTETDQTVSYIRGVPSPDPRGVGVGLQVVLSIDGPEETRALTWDGSYLWLSDMLNPFVFKYTTSAGTATLVEKIYLGVSGVYMCGFVIKCDSTHVFVATPGKLIIIEKSSSSVVGICDCGGAFSIDGVAVDGDNIYCAVATSTQYELEHYSKSAALAAYPTAVSADLVVANPVPLEEYGKIVLGGGKLWVAGGYSQKIHKVNPTTLVVEATYTHSSADMWDLLYSFGSLWVTSRTSGTAMRFDPVTFPAGGSLLATISFVDITMASGITTDGTYVYVSDLGGSAAVEAIEPDTNSTVGGSAAGTGEGFFDLVWDGSYLWTVATGVVSDGLRSFQVSPLVYNGAYTEPSVLVYASPGGDLGGSWPAPSVTGLQGLAISSTTPTDGQALVYNSADQWHPETISFAPSKKTYVLSSGEMVGTTLLANARIIGSDYFDPEDWIGSETGRTRSVYFRAILSSSSGSITAYVSLYDKDGITNAGTPCVVSGSVLSTTDTSPTRLSVDLSSVLGSVTDKGIIEAQIYVSAEGENNAAVCLQAKLDVEWV